MTVRFFITIDTEEDEWGEYQSSGHHVENVKQLARLQEIFDHFGAVPTYLVTYPVVKSDLAREVLGDILSKSQCEIGTHCHPWNTPPFEEELGKRNSMLCNLPDQLVLRKIETLDMAITESLGVKPRCFRAGRWGFGSNVANAIQNLGYQVDTSVTPFVDWGNYCGPDFRNAPQQAYRFSPSDVLSMRSDGCLLEVPATIGFLQNNFERCHRLIQSISGSTVRRLRLRGILDRTRMLNFRWLSPELSNGKDMVALAKTCLLRSASYLNMSFHSTTLLPGKSPFVRTHAELESFLRNIEIILQFAANEGLVFANLSDVLREDLTDTK